MAQPRDVVLEYDAAERLGKLQASAEQFVCQPPGDDLSGVGQTKCFVRRHYFEE